MLFHKNTKKFANVGIIIISILVVISMLLLYFPAVSGR
ncbi:MAG: hypothetical protein JWO00_348 [Candidatus Parcubacteria bacterium]|nr:hypothetical protein [Candidatus Parcubacteria bacterium]